jgi:DNA-binding CsgD family transcriptional regulator
MGLGQTTADERRYLDPPAGLLAILQEFATRAGAGPAASLLVVGETGAGKTALLESAAESARAAGARLVWMRGEQVGGAPYALLRCLLDQLADVLAGLPDDHQAALLSAAGRHVEAPAFPIQLGTAVVNLVRTASAAQPVLMVADDIQRLNTGAAHRLAYIARRLTGSRTRLLLASSPHGAGVHTDVADLVLHLPRPVTALEDDAAHARDRGDVAAAAAALRRAAELSDAAADRARRYAAAACTLIGTSGNLAEVKRSLADARRAQALAPDAAESLEFVTVDCYLDVNKGVPFDTLRQRLVQCLRDRHPATADWVYEEATWVLYGFCWFLNRPEVWTEFSAVTAQNAGRLPAWARLAGPLMNGVDMGRADLAAEADSLLDALPDERRPWRVVRMAQVTRYRDHRFGWRTALQRLWAERDEAGATVPATYAAAVLADDLTGSGDWDAAHELTRPALAMCADLAHWSFSEGWLLYMSARVAAHRGDTGLVRRQTSRLLSWAGPRGAREMATRGLHCRAIAALADGDPVRAHRHLVAIGDPRGYSAQLLIDPLMALDFAEAAVGAAAGEDVAELLTRVGPVASRSAASLSSDWRALQFTGAFAIAATGSPGHEADVDRLYQRALAVPGADRWPVDLARIRLSYGEWLWAQGRTEDARRQLRLAAGTFRHLRALPWLGRTTDLLSSVGDVHQRIPTGAALTAMEQRVADLAASGLTNRQVATQLRISVSTVSSQLSRIYAKLGVRSRATLRDAL